MRSVGLLFGSFDPIHIGHTTIAQWTLGSNICDEVWMVLSPQNPMKPTTAAPYKDREAMVRLAIEDIENVELCTIEQELAPPFYTINTVERLIEKFPEYKFSIVCGTDVKNQSRRWHRSDQLHQMVEFVEYPRYSGGSEPFVDVSSTEIRRGEKWHQGLNPKVAEYIEKQKVYCIYLERGRELYREGDICGAINEWQRCTSGRHKEVAQTHIELANNIMAYRYSDIYNP